MRIVRNLNRHRLGTSLAVTGVAIGIAVLTTAGALAAGFDASVEGRARYFGSYVRVESAAGQAGSLVPLAKIEEIRQVPGVAAAFPTYSFPARPGSAKAAGFGMPDAIIAGDPTEAAWSDLKTTYAQGHAIDADSSGEVVLGSAIAREFNKKIGDTIDLPVRPRDAGSGFVNHTFKVVGILNETQTAPDTSAYVNITDGQILLKDSLPAAMRDSTDVTKVAGAIDVYARSRTSIATLDQVADRINRQVGGVRASRPSGLIDGYRQTGSVYGNLTVAAALLVLAIGGFAVLTAMFKAVAERKKMAEASRPEIVGELLTESALIGLLGGVIGFGVGVLITVVANAPASPGGPPSFVITPGLGALVIVFATLVGLVSGALPAWRAAGSQPATAPAKG